MSFRIVSFSIFFSIISTINGDKSVNGIFGDTNEVDNDNSIFFYSNELKTCNMYNNLCFLNLMVEKNSVFENLNVEIEDNSRALVEKIIQCETLNQTTINKDLNLECNKINKSDSHYTYLIQINPILIGYTSLTISAKSENKSFYAKKFLVVKEPKRLIDRIVLVYILIMAITISLLMGILLDLDSLKKLIKIPIPVAIGFICQYLIMPLLAFGIAKLFNFGNAESFALFIFGCSPGGNISSAWTIIFNGDIDLSVIMTFCSTAASLFMMPAWIYSLGSLLSTKANIQIPFLNLFTNLLAIVIPCFIGFLISIYSPKVKKFIMPYAKRFIIAVIISFFIFLFTSKMFIFKLFTIKNCLSVFIPWFGFALGALTAFIFRFPKNQILTICIETGFQNQGLAYLIVSYNFPSPESDMALLPLIVLNFLAPLPFYIILLLRFILNCIKKKKDTKNKEAEKKFQNEILEESAKMLEKIEIYSKT